MKRVFSALLVLLLVVGLMPVQARAESVLVQFSTQNIYYESVTWNQNAERGERVTVTPDAAAASKLTDHVLESVLVYAVTGDGYSSLQPHEDNTFTIPEDLPTNGYIVVQPQYSMQRKSISVSINAVVPNSSIDVYWNQFQDPGDYVTITSRSNAAAQLEGYVLDEIVEVVVGEDERLESDKQGFQIPNDFTALVIYVYVNYKPAENNDTSEMHNITVITDGNGSAYAALNGTLTTKAAANETVSVVTTPNSGYELESITAVDGSGSIAVTNGTFTMPASDVTVTVTFKPSQVPDIPEDAVKYRIYKDTVANGSIATNVDEAAEGTEITITATPDTGYELKNLTVRDSDNNEVSVYGGKFTMPNRDVTVSATFGATQEINPGSNIEHTTNPDENTYHADINLPDIDVIKRLLTQDEITSQENIRVYMEVTPLVPADDARTAITGKAGNDVVASYVDISLYKEIGNNPREKISSRGNAIPIVMTLDNGLIPANATKVYIVYYHGGAAKTLEASYNHSTSGLSFTGYEFSPYAVVYSTTAASATTTSAGTLDNVPKTGESAALLSWTLLVLCSTAMLAAVAVFDKKRAR